MKHGMIINENDVRVWWHHGKIHRTDGPAIEWKDGTRIWYYHGEHHRTDGPAIEYANGDRMWYCNGKLHRTDGPAVEWANGTRKWYYHDKQYTFAEWLKHNTTLDSKTRMLYMLRYSEEVIA